MNLSRFWPKFTLCNPTVDPERGQLVMLPWGLIATITDVYLVEDRFRYYVGAARRSFLAEELLVLR